MHLSKFGSNKKIFGGVTLFKVTPNIIPSTPGKQLLLYLSHVHVVDCYLLG